MTDNPKEANHTDLCAAMYEVNGCCCTCGLKWRLEIESLQSTLNLYENGYKGACYACEKTGEINITLRDAADNYRQNLLKQSNIIESLQAENRGLLSWAIGEACEHGRGLTDYCEPCGRVNAG